MKRMLITATCVTCLSLSQVANGQTPEQIGNEAQQNARQATERAADNVDRATEDTSNNADNSAQKRSDEASMQADAEAEWNSNDATENDAHAQTELGVDQQSGDRNIDVDADTIYRSGYRGGAVQSHQYEGYSGSHPVMGNTSTWASGPVYTLRYDAYGREFICVNGQPIYFDHFPQGVTNQTIRQTHTGQNQVSGAAAQSGQYSAGYGSYDSESAQRFDADVNRQQRPIEDRDHASLDADRDLTRQDRMDENADNNTSDDSKASGDENSGDDQSDENRSQPDSDREMRKSDNNSDSNSDWDADVDLPESSL